MLIALRQFFLSMTHCVTRSVCVFCSAKADHFANLCEPCFQILPILTQICYQCARPLTFSEHLRCGKCVQHPPPFERCFALFAYESPINRLIHDLKFNGALQHANLLGTLLTHIISNKWYDQLAFPDLIVPVPLHAVRLRERGFNQALEIARPIYKKLDISIDMKSIKRVRATLPQTTLSAQQRKANLRHAFATTRRFDHLTVAILDDVMTTGITLATISKLLKANGAKSVHIWCCARRHIALKPQTI